MVKLKENEVVITIPHLSPEEFLSELQIGIIEMVKSFLSTGSAGEDLTLDRETADGCVVALEFLQATLPEPEFQEEIQEVTRQVLSSTVP